MKAFYSDKILVEISSSQLETIEDALFANYRRWKQFYKESNNQIDLVVAEQNYKLWEEVCKIQDNKPF